MTKTSIFFFSLFILILIFSFIGPELMPTQIGEIQIEKSFCEVSSKNWIGCDALGRDLLYRVLMGGRASISIGIFTTGFSFLIGIILASFFSYFFPRLDFILLGAIEILQAIPTIILITLLLQFLIIDGENLLNDAIKISLVIGLCSWTLIARTSRNLFIQIRAKPYVEAARAIGNGPCIIFIRHILPNSIRPILITVGLQLPGFILFESIFSFLGTGLQPPLSSWGLLVQDGWRALAVYPHVVLGPSIFLFATVFSAQGAMYKWKQKS